MIFLNEFALFAHDFSVEEFQMYGYRNILNMITYYGNFNSVQKKVLLWIRRNRKLLNIEESATSTERNRNEEKTDLMEEIKY